MGTTIKTIIYTMNRNEIFKLIKMRYQCVLIEFTLQRKITMICKSAAN